MKVYSLECNKITSNLQETLNNNGVGKNINDLYKNLGTEQIRLELDEYNTLLIFEAENVLINIIINSDNIIKTIEIHNKEDIIKDFPYSEIIEEYNKIIPKPKK